MNIRQRQSLAGASIRPRPPASRGAGSSYTNLRVEPPDHAIGRSRGGLSTKIHQLIDGAGRPLVVLRTPGHAGDCPMFLPLMAQLRVRSPSGRPRTRPVRVRGDKAYSFRAIRGHRRYRGIQAVIVESDDQTGHRKRRGSRGGRPPGFDSDDYRSRNVIERAFCSLKQWQGLATRYEKLAISCRAKELGQKDDGSGESVGHKSGRRIVTILGMKKADLTVSDAEHMHKVAGYVKRHRAQEPESDVRHSRWRYSLMN
ncbi:MAG: IS5 family transposase [Salinibacterium sp.]|nr:IS5 family transposase [Salinibacterium sp.]